MMLATSQSTIQWLMMCCLCWSKDIPQQSDSLVIDQISQHLVIENFMVQQLMDVLDQDHVHQSLLRYLACTKLEYSLERGVSRIYPPSRNYSTAWECRNTLVRSLQLATSPLRG